MKDLTISVLSTEYVRVPISATEEGARVDPTSDVVAFAFVQSGTPEGEDWVTGEWETAGTAYYARCLVGPGATDLQAGYWNVWVKVTDNPEIPVKRAGGLTIAA